MGEHGIRDEAPNPVAVAAVVFAPCVKVFGVSPGNCTAVCGLTDADALIPAAPPPDDDPIPEEPAAGANVGEVDILVEPTLLDEVVADELASQPSPIERLPMNEQDVPGRIVPFPVVDSNAEEVVLDSVLVVDVPVPEVVPFWKVP